MLAGLLLQVSLFVAPLYRDEAPPESRSVRALMIAWDHSAKEKQVELREQARELARGFAVRLRSGSSFDELCTRARSVEREWGSRARHVLSRLAFAARR